MKTKTKLILAAVLVFLSICTAQSLIALKKALDEKNEASK